MIIIFCSINNRIVLIVFIDLTKVELKAIPKFSVINEIFPAIALSAFDNANPMPLTVPIKPTEGIAHINYLIIALSLSCFVDSISILLLIESETF